MLIKIMFKVCGFMIRCINMKTKVDRPIYIYENEILMKFSSIHGQTDGKGRKLG